MELFFHYAPSNESREKMMAAIEETKAFATGEPHRFETLHSTLSYLGEVDEARLPELMRIVKDVCGRHAPLKAVGDSIMLSHDTSVYNAWGLLYIWKKTKEMQDVYDDICNELAKANFWSDAHGGRYMPHSTMYMKYYPNEPEKEEKPTYFDCDDCFDKIIISQVTVIDGHVAYYPLYACNFKK